MKMTNIIVRHLINWERRNNMHKEMESSVFFSIFQLMQFMKYQGMKRMEELDIKPSQAGILFSLKCWGEQSQRQLAQRAGITPPSMTVALRKMEEKGYVSRKTDEKDQRITRIQLAPKGEECIDGIRRVLTEMEEIIYQGISREEVLLMKRLLAEMKNNLLESKDFKGVDRQTIMEKTHPSMKHM